MTIFSAHQNFIHRSVFHRIAGPAEEAIAAPRRAGAVRYRCPESGSFVLLTDAESLAGFNGGDDTLRHRCGACGEMHLLRIEDSGES
ncbi:MAG: hypothetical protein KIT48_21870 [Pseudolabrys sp.]|nr:hypothetical protein [Pseudolabrys sp.]